MIKHCKIVLYIKWNVLDFVTYWGLITDNESEHVQYFLQLSRPRHPVAEWTMWDEKQPPPPPAKMFQSLPVPTQSAEILQFLYTQVPEVRPDIVGLHVCRWRVVIRRLYCEFPRSKVRKGNSGLSRCWVCVVPLVSFCSTNVEKLICGVLRSSSLDGRFRLGGRASERGREAGDWVTKWTP